MEGPVSAQEAEHLGGEEAKSEFEQCSSNTLDEGGVFSVSDEDSAAALDAGATANSVCFR